jgi:hypothetical protein
MENRMKRSRLVAMLGGLALLGVFTIGSAASVFGATDYATVSGHQAFSEDANHEDYWGTDCTKIESVDGSLGDSYVLTNDYALVVVKAGSGANANTMFENPTAGQTVWADTNGDFVFNPGGQDGDKNISHIIFCGPTPEVTPAPTPEVTPEATPEVTPEATPEVTPEATPEVTPEATPEVTPAATPEVTPEATPEVTPASTPATTPGGGVLGETSNPTGPSTDISANDSVTGGVNMGIVLLALGALAIVTLLVTPVPAKIRERGRRK